MRSADVPRHCPKCGSVLVHPHCDGPEGGPCDLIRCDGCGSYGTVDGRRWQKKVGK